RGGGGAPGAGAIAGGPGAGGDSRRGRGDQLYGGVPDRPLLTAQHPEQQAQRPGQGRRRLLSFCLCDQQPRRRGPGNQQPLRRPGESPSPPAAPVRAHDLRPPGADPEAARGAAPATTGDAALAERGPAAMATDAATVAAPATTPAAPAAGRG